MGKYCYTNAAVKIESIFIGSRISLQVKLYEAVVEPSASGMKRLLARPKANSKVLEHQNNMISSSNNLESNDQDNQEDNGSLVGSDIEDNDVVSSPPKQSAVKKVVRRVKKVSA
jgi:hypothetical protein